MSHKKEIYTSIVKILPASVNLVERQIGIEDFNALCAAFYYLFNSNALTKGDYLHIFEVLIEKFPIYEQSGDTQKYKESVIAYAEYGYPKAPDMARVIGDFADHIQTIPVFRLQKALHVIKEKTMHATPFVGKELHAKGFSLTPLSEGELATIKRIVLV